MTSQIIVNVILIAFCGILLLYLYSLEAHIKHLYTNRAEDSKRIMTCAASLQSILDALPAEQKEAADKNFARIIKEITDNIRKKT